MPLHCVGRLCCHVARAMAVLMLLVGVAQPTWAGSHAGLPSRHVPAFKATSLLALADGGLLIWTANGEAQLRTGAGEWRPAWHMPLHHVLQLVRREGGFVALGLADVQAAADAFRVVAFDGAGKETERWQVPPSWTLASSETGLWAVSEHEMQVPLLSAGRLGSPVSVPLWQDQPPRDVRFATSPLRWQRFEWGDVTVYCHDADVTKQSHAVARCHRPGAEGWVQAFGDRRGGSAIAACGPWLVTWVGTPAGQLTVIDMLSGQVTARRTYKDVPVVQCASRDELLVGRGRRMELLALPDLAVRWRSSRLPGAVVAVAAGEREIVYRLGGAPDILSTPRPHGD